MRYKAALLLVCLGTVGCADDALAPRAEQMKVKPMANHTYDPSRGEITANNYHLSVDGAAMSSDYLGQGMIFGGNMAYATSDQSLFHVNLATGASDFYGTGLPMEMSTNANGADAYSSSLFVEKPSLTLGPKTKLGLYTVRETYAYTDADNDDYLIVKYTITNPTNTTVSGLYTGMLLDPDVVNAVTNTASFDAAQNAAIVHANGTSTLEHAVVLLNRPAATYKTTTNGTDPTTNAAWFALFSGGIQPGVVGPADVRQYIGAAPITLGAGETTVLAVALVAGSQDAGLAANIAAAQAKSGALLAPRPVTPVQVSVHAGTVAFSASITFANAAQAAAFNPSTTVCGGAAIQDAVASGNRVDVTFNALDVDPQLQTGDEFYCSGRLSDDTYFAGFDFPPLVQDVTPVTALTTYTGDDYTPAFSPDGSRVVFGSARNGGGLFVMDVATGDASAVQLTNDVSDTQPSWSSDGHTIVFTRGRNCPTCIEGGLFTVDVNTHVVTRITTNFDFTVSSNPAFHVDSDPRFSPDGTRIAFRRFTGGALTSTSPGGNHVWVLNTAAGESSAASLAVLGTQDIMPRWSPDGSTVYFQSTLGAIYAIDANGGTPVRVTDDEAASWSFPAFTPDGKTMAAISAGKIVYMDLASDLHTVPLFDPRVLSLTTATTKQNLQWSPDGTRLMFVSAGQIMIASPKHVVSAEERAAGLEQSISALEADGLISSSDAATLTSKLGHVTELVQAGNVNTALNNLNAFLNKVEAMIHSRRINEITGEQLTTNANALIDQLEG